MHLWEKCTEILQLQRKLCCEPSLTCHLIHTGMIKPWSWQTQGQLHSSRSVPRCVRHTCAWQICDKRTPRWWIQRQRLLGCQSYKNAKQKESVQRQSGCKMACAQICHPRAARKYLSLVSHRIILYTTVDSNPNSPPHPTPQKSESCLLCTSGSGALHHWKEQRDRPLLEQWCVIKNTQNTMKTQWQTEKDEIKETAKSIAEVITSGSIISTILESAI